MSEHPHWPNRAPSYFDQWQIAGVAATLLSEPITPGWKIACAIFAVLVVAAFAAALYFAVRAWRSSSLFDRQYRFPDVSDTPVRLGAPKSGGCMAILAFGQPGVSSRTREERPPQ
jgi:hypothetical protein